VTVGLFNLVAVATQHEHWLKDKEDVIPITGPLKAWVNELDAKTLKRNEKNLAPTLFVVGVATVAGPDAVAEMRIRAQEKRAKLALSQPPARARVGTTVATPAGISSTDHTANGHAAGGRDWYSGIPSGPPIDTSLDA